MKIRSVTGQYEERCAGGNSDSNDLVCATKGRQPVGASELILPQPNVAITEMLFSFSVSQASTCLILEGDALHAGLTSPGIPGLVCNHSIRKCSRTERCHGELRHVQNMPP